ncbi:ABC transporter ATP-binding protein [Microvirga sp. G4-2]|uniref:ABC transporter ATP-binding protein n=1 Tax=Microvirga sp. G4-2 TaxID=3434467 RepID=UPI004043A343
MLVLEGIHAGYDQGNVLHGISLEIKEGEVVCLIGRNGIGKSSTMRSVVQNQIKVHRGSIRFLGQELTGRKPHEIVRLGIGYVPEDRRVFSSLTVAENLATPKHRAPPAGLREWNFDRVFGLFPKLQVLMSRQAGVLSGGEQQMLSIARALMIQPRLLLLDEPHEGLAPIISEQVIDAINVLKKEGVAMLVSEQQIRLIENCADRVYVLDRGAIAFSGSAQEFLKDPEIARRHLMIG